MNVEVCQLRYCFVSIVGTQIMGTVNPLLSLLAEGMPLSSACLLYDDDVADIAERLKAFCSSRGLEALLYRYDLFPERKSGGVSAGDAMLKVVKESKIRNERCIVNVNGGTNRHLTECLLAASSLAPSLVQSTKERVLLSSNSWDGSGLWCKTTEVLPTGELLRLQGVSWASAPVAADDRTVERFCQNSRTLRLPRGALVNVSICGQDFDAVWNRGNNRLAFLAWWFHGIRDASNEERLDRIRALARWAADRKQSGHVYDRDVYVGVPDETSAEHLRIEGGGKIEALVLKDTDAKIDALTRWFSPCAMQKSQPVEPKKRKPHELPEEALVMALGLQPASTLNCIASHRPRNLVLLGTFDKVKSISCMAQAIEGLKDKLGVERVIRINCDFEGSAIPAVLGTPSNPAGIAVNASPGTKGQGAFLALWAARHGCQVWTLEPQTQKVVRLDKHAQALDLLAIDPRILLEVKEGDRCEFADDFYREVHSFCDGLLDAVASAGSFWDILKYVKKHAPNRLAPGEWLELAACRAFERAGAAHVHHRVRLRGSKDWEHGVRARHDFGDDKEVHLQDMDVVGSFGGAFFLVSCKANPQDETSMDMVAREARNMAASIARGTLPMLCHAGCREPYFDEKAKVSVFGLKELCNPTYLRERIKFQLKLLNDIN